MKKVITLLSALCFITTIVSAQFEKGDKVLGAGLSFLNSTTNGNSNQTSVYKTTNSNAGLSVDLGIAVKPTRLNGFYLGGGLGSSKSTYNNLPSFNTNSDYYNFSGGFFSRRSRPIGKDFFLFAEGQAGFMYSHTKSENSNYVKGTTLGVAAGLYPGLSYKAGKRFLLDLRFADFISLSYDQLENTTAAGAKDKTSSIRFNSSLGLGYLQNIGIGARWIIPQGGSRR